MANSQIPSWTIPALVISFNHVTFIEPDDHVIGKVIDVPCKNDNIYDNENMWAVPQKDYGIFTGFTFLLKEGENLAQPTYDSFTVFRLRDKNYNEWMIYGTKDNFFDSCATCCDTDGVPMPGIDPSFGIRIAPCQIIDLENGNGDPYAIFGIPSLGAGERYFPYGSLNNAAFPPANPSGYATVTAMLAFLNSNWTGFAWTADGSQQILFATGGTAGNSLCVNIAPIVPSL